MIRVALLVAAACSSNKPAPEAPRPAKPDIKTIAKRMQQGMLEMAEITRQTRTACPQMAARLRELFPRMRVDLDEAKRVSDDPELAKQLTTELKTYDTAMRGAADEVFASLAACKDDRDVQQVMTTMPTL